MNPAEERERLRVVREALDLLAEGEPITLVEAVPNGSSATRQAVRRVLYKLVGHRVIEKVVSAGIGQPVRFHVAHPEALDALRKNDADLADVIWPGQATSEAPPDEDLGIAESEPAEVAPVSLDEKIDTMMRVLHTALVALADIKEKVEAMGVRAEAMEVKVNRLHAELTGEKG